MWINKPFRGVQLDPAHLLAQKVSYALLVNEWVGTQVFDTKRKFISPYVITGASWIPPRGLEFDTHPEYVAIDADFPGTQICIFFVYQRTTSATSYNRIYQTSNGANMNLYRENSDTSWSIRISSTSVWTGVDLSKLLDGNRHTVSINADLPGSNGYIRIWIDGKLEWSYENSGQVKSDISDTLYLGGRVDGYVGTQCAGIIECFYVFPIVLNNSELKMLHENEWCMFRDVYPVEFFSIAGGTTYEVSLGLAIAAAISLKGEAEVEGDISFTENLSLSNLAQANTEGISLININTQITSKGQSNSSASIPLDEVLFLTSKAIAHTDGEITISKSSSLEAISESQTQGQINIFIEKSLDTKALSQSQGEITIPQQLGINSKSKADTEAQLNVNKDLSIVTMAGSISEGSINIAKQLTQSFVSYRSVEVDFSLAENLGLSSQARTVSESSIVLQMGKNISSVAKAQAGASLTISFQTAIETKAISQISATIALALSKGININVSLELQAQLSLETNLGLDSKAQADTEGSVGLSKSLAFVLLGEAIAGAGLQISSIQSLQFVENIILANVTLPDGRTVTISLETRTVSIPSESRIITVDSEDRIIKL